MEIYSPRFTRRRLLAGLTAGAFSFPLWKVFAEERLRFIDDGDYWQELVPTPRMTEGPFYPDRMPLDTDNDLLVIGNGSEAVGEVAHLAGRVLALNGEPVKSAVVEIWQVDSRGAYIHSGSANRASLDKNFQGFGRFETASDGKYRFRTIKPVPYPGRTPHIHVKVKKGDRELLTTQCFVKGNPQNERDGILRGIRDSRQRESVIVPFEKVDGSRIGELSAKFDIVLGFTPAAD